MLQPTETRKTEKTKGLTLSDLKIVEVDEDDDGFLEEADSDDEHPGSEGPPDNEMTATAINLLLSILEGELLSYASQPAGSNRFQ